MGTGRGDDLRLHEVNVACLFWTFFTVFADRNGGKYRIHISNKDASEVFTMFGNDLTLKFSCTTFASKQSRCKSIFFFVQGIDELPTKR